MRAPRWLLVPAALPIVATMAIDPGAYAPFGPAKWAAVSTVVLAAAAAAASRGIGSIERTTATWWLAFLGWTAVCAFAGVDWFYAFVGTPERHAGLVLWGLAALAYVTGQRIAPFGARVVAQGAALAAAALGVYSLVELVWRAPVLTDATPGRLGGPFGSAAFLGAACCLLGPVAVGVAVDTRTARPWRAVGVVGSVGSLVALAGSGTRGAWLAAMVAGVVVAAHRPAALRRRPELVVTLVAAAWLVAAAVALVGPRGGTAGTVVSRATPLTARVDEWRVGWRAFADSPVLGVGPEGYRVVFPTFVDERYEQAYGRDVLPDRVHQTPLDLAVTVGLPGLVLYAGIVVGVGRRVLRVLRGGDAVLVGMAAGVVAYAAQQLVLFPVAELEPVAWLLTGLLVAVVETRPVASAVRARTAATPLAVLAAVALVLGGLDVLADRAVRRSVVAAAAGRPGAAVDAATTAARLRPDQLRYRVAAARAYAPLQLARALHELDLAEGWSRREPVLPIERAAVLGTAAGWQAALDVDPLRARSWLGLADAARRTGDVVTAERAWERAAQLAPDDVAAYLALARLFIDQRRWTDAHRAVTDADALDANESRVEQLRDELARLGHPVPAAATR